MKPRSFASMFVKYVWGAIAAIGTWFILFTIVFIIYGRDYFEWGVFFSFGFSSAVLIANYIFNSLVIIVALSLFRKSVLLDLRLFLFLGAVTALVLFVLSEIPLVASPLQKSLDWGYVQLIGVIISCLIVIGYTLIQSHRKNRVAKDFHEKQCNTPQ